MLKLILFVLISYGVANIVTQAHGPFNCFTKLREYAENHFPSNLGEMFSCMICFPFWVGVFISLFFYSPTAEILNIIQDNYFNILSVLLCDGAIASGTTWFLHNIEEYYEYGVEKE